MQMYRLISLLPMLLLLGFAAVQDVRTRKIRNWLTACMVLSGIAHSIAWPSSITPGDSILGTLVGFGLPLLLFIIGALGGGDVKLMAGMGAWLGVSGVIQVFAGTAIVGMVIVLVQSAATGRLKLLLSNTYLLVIQLLNADEEGMKQVVRTGQSCRSIDRPLPYAVPVLLSTLLMLTV